MVEGLGLEGLGFGAAAELAQPVVTGFQAGSRLKYLTKALSPKP